jgi:hypothetical protein
MLSLTLLSLHKIIERRVKVNEIRGRIFGGMILRAKRRSTRGQSCFIVNLSTTNPTWTGPESNPALRGEGSEILLNCTLCVRACVRV